MKSVRHTGIVVNDIDRSLFFYRDLLGMEVIKDANEKGTYLDRMLGLKGAIVRTVKMAALDGNLIELLFFKSPPATRKNASGATETGISHIAFTVGNIKSLYGKLRESGVPFNAPPEESPDGKALVAFCKDPDGNLLELVEVVR